MSPYFSYKNGALDGAHNLLKDLARTTLENQGFTVEFEKLIKIDCGPQQRYKVDVYGKRDEEILMYECGTCTQEKLDWLREHIGKTIHMPYLDQWCSSPYGWRKLLNNKERQLYISGRLTERLTRRVW